MRNGTVIGALLGTGAAINVELGFIPDHVKIVNLTDGDLITEWFRGKYIPFSSGGTTEIVAGNTIEGATSGAKAYIREVLLASGSWAGGDAAGYFKMNEDDITGTFGSENVFVPGGTNDATVTVQAEYSAAIASAVTGATGNAAISSYSGSEGAHAKGFTIGSTVSEDNKLLVYIATRSDA
jgi:hypothetical protein